MCRTPGGRTITDVEDMETEEITMTCTWETSHTVEVPVGWRPGDRLDEFPDSVLEQLSSQGAELVDWR